jgi:hypothetical protein
MKPAANANKANINPVVGSAFAKNCLAITAASDPYKKKSYHSNTVPNDEAISIFRSSLLIGLLAVFVSLKFVAVISILQKFSQLGKIVGNL